jgi:Fur family ferric uptake transcriptional regulator
MSTLLREHGFRVTKGKQALLQALHAHNAPLSVGALHEALGKHAPNPTTLYRSLLDLANAGIVRRTDLNTGIAHFEYTPERPHHHHIVCTSCNAIEEIDLCNVGTLEKKVARASKQFAHIDTHSLEFFGHCRACAQ